MYNIIHGQEKGREVRTDEFHSGSHLLTTTRPAFYQLFLASQVSSRYLHCPYRHLFFHEIIAQMNLPLLPPRFLSGAPLHARGEDALAALAAAERVLEDKANKHFRGGG